jgi:hypothetical protein
VASRLFAESCHAVMQHSVAVVIVAAAVIVAAVVCCSGSTGSYQW